jgi:hypothetical protein
MLNSKDNQNCVRIGNYQFSANQVIGQGVTGMVYRGMLFLIFR